MSTHNITFWWRTDENYPWIIIKYPPYQLHWFYSITKLVQYKINVWEVLLARKVYHVLVLQFCCSFQMEFLYSLGNTINKKKTLLRTGLPLYCLETVRLNCSLDVMRMTHIMRKPTLAICEQQRVGHPPVDGCHCTFEWSQTAQHLSSLFLWVGLFSLFSDRTNSPCWDVFHTETILQVSGHCLFV